MEPLVSCLIVTQGGREALARRAIDCWRRQSYRPLELVIVSDGSIELTNSVRAFAPEAVVVLTAPGQTLGELRNKSIAASSGDILCQWDDDDQYHPERVAKQFEWMQSRDADACFLSMQLHYFTDTRELYVRDTGLRGIEGTVMHRRKPEVSYPALSKGEDTRFMERLRDRYRAAVLDGYPWLYLRVFHGKNTFDEEHHRGTKAGSLDRRSLEAIRSELARQLDHYQIGHPVTVCGQDGKAFVL